MSTGIDRRELLNELEKALNINELSVFIGAGLSKGAGNFDWKGLLREPALKLNLDVSKENDLVSLAQYYCNEEGRARINRLIREAFPSTLPTNENYELLSKLPIDIYWTTNYDKLIERSLMENGRETLIISKDNNLHLQSKNYDAVVYKMHGDIDEPNEAVLTRDDYERYGITDRTLFKNVLEGHLITNTFLFLGFSFTDPNFNFVLGKLNALTNGNTRRHYCLIKSIKKEDFIIDIDQEIYDEEEFLYQQVKQQLVIKDLKNRYNIETFLMESYDDITSILGDLYNRYRMKTIFISGSADGYEPLDEKQAQKFISSLAYRLVEKGYHIVNGYGKGVGSYIIDGVTEYCYFNEDRRISDYLTLMPFPRNSVTKRDLKETWSKYREEMISGSGIAIFMFGNKKVKEEIVLADGMYEELEIANKFNLNIVSLEFTGSVAEQICNDSEYIVEGIKSFKDINLTVEEIIEKIDELNKRG